MNEISVAQERNAIEPLALRVHGLEAWYGDSHVLHGMQFDVAEGEIVTLIGRNGAGKTTTLKSIMGIVKKRRGAICYNSVETIAMASRSIARLGIGYVPQERGIFSSLTVLENLMLPPKLRSGGLPLDQVLRLFPNLAERLAAGDTQLSGGEQQMLAIGRILRTGARLILLDEPTEGLAPVIVRLIGESIAELKRNGLTVILVEQNFHFARMIADRHYVVEQGRVVDTIARPDVDSNADRIKAYLGV